MNLMLWYKALLHRNVSDVSERVPLLLNDLSTHCIFRDYLVRFPNTTGRKVTRLSQDSKDPTETQLSLTQGNPQQAFQQIICVVDVFQF